MTMRSKKMGLMLAAAFALMPFPALVDAQVTSASQPSQHSVTVSAQTPLNRAGVAINGTMKAAIDPIKIDNMVYVPFKEMARILGYDDIRYSYSTKTYTATDGSVTVKATIGGSRAMKGDERISIRPLKFINRTTYISVDAVSALFNTFTYYKPANGSIQVQMPARKYVVQFGDTLWQIAQAHHTTIWAVKSANAVADVDNLRVGQVLNLPAESQTKEMEPVRQAQQQPAPEPTPQTSTSVLDKSTAIINTGKKYLGRPYKFGAKPEQAPQYMDCSSFVQYVFKVNGVTLPRDSRQQSNEGTKVTALKPGDLLFFKYPEKYSDGRVGHVGIYMGNGQMIHTIPRTGVTITNYQKSGYWSRNFLFAKRVLQ
ncbi:MAG TPA: NlpC/P60 family protein [Bacilli bacterium]|nr:NlpC/P60 family protein [Bacilli bacterium]